MIYLALLLVIYQPTLFLGISEYEFSEMQD